jgi:hypothetical protein
MTTPQRPKMAIFHHTLPNGDILRLVRADEYAKLETERDQLQAQIKKIKKITWIAGCITGCCRSSGHMHKYKAELDASETWKAWEARIMREIDEALSSTQSKGKP